MDHFIKFICKFTFIYAGDLKKQMLLKEYTSLYNITPNNPTCLNDDVTNYYIQNGDIQPNDSTGLRLYEDAKKTIRQLSVDNKDKDMLMDTPNNDETISSLSASVTNFGKILLYY